MLPNRWIQVLVVLIASSVPLAPLPHIAADNLLRSHSGLSGSLILVPRSATGDVTGKFVELAGKLEARLVIVADDTDTTELVELRNQINAHKPKSLRVVKFAPAVDPDAFDDVDGIWWAAQAEPTLQLGQRLRDGLASRRVLVVSGNAVSRVGDDGWRCLEGSIVHASPNDDHNNAVLHAKLAQAPGTFGLQLDNSAESTLALVIQGREIRQLGTGIVRFVLSASTTRPARSEGLNPQGADDLTLWRRAARARTEAPFPIEKPAAPIVEHGSLVIVGGGGMPDDVSKKFLELAGGPEAPIVVLPTSLPDPLPLDSGAALFKRLGAKQVTVLRARQKAEVEAADNLAALRAAKGIWFGGGRQWRFVDAYEGTAAYELLHDVLRRGGVIGGSSAGATIQGDYLVRGSPYGPHVMMCEGYERGFAFLPGVAIDQHFAQRKRFADMTALMKRYPQYLGIGLDEATALVVQGRVATVLGRGEVHLYDRRLPAPSTGRDFRSFKAGTRLDLVARCAVE